MRSTIAVLVVFSVLVVGCAQEEPGLTEPCEETCNDAAPLGAVCQAAEDCATGEACNLAFPGGYCQGFCEEEDSAGAVCDEGQGLCIPSLEGAPACLGGCDDANPDSCTRPEHACYPLEGSVSGGVCHLRCANDANCGDGQGCDGRGVCRLGVSGCDALSNAGCPQDMGCYLSAAGQPFCGLPGPSGLGQACGRIAGCTPGLWCIENQCRKLCSMDDRASCSNVPQFCTPVARGVRLGYCRR